MFNQISQGQKLNFINNRGTKSATNPLIELQVNHVNVLEIILIPLLFILASSSFFLTL